MDIPVYSEQKSNVKTQVQRSRMNEKWPWKKIPWFPREILLPSGKNSNYIIGRGAVECSLDEMIASRHSAGVFVIKTHTHTRAHVHIHKSGCLYPSVPLNQRKVKRCINMRRFESGDTFYFTSCPKMLSSSNHINTHCKLLHAFFKTIDWNHV